MLKENFKNYKKEIEQKKDDIKKEIKVLNNLLLDRVEESVKDGEFETEEEAIKFHKENFRNTENGSFDEIIGILKEELEGL